MKHSGRRDGPAHGRPAGQERRPDGHAVSEVVHQLASAHVRLQALQVQQRPFLPLGDQGPQVSWGYLVRQHECHRTRWCRPVSDGRRRRRLGDGLAMVVVVVVAGPHESVDEDAERDPAEDGEASP